MVLIIRNNGLNVSSDRIFLSLTTNRLCYLNTAELVSGAAEYTNMRIWFDSSILLLLPASIVVSPSVPNSKFLYNLGPYLWFLLANNIIS